MMIPKKVLKRMNDLVELLMIEHGAIRHLSKYISNDSDEDLIGFHEYLKNVHIEVEEKIVFAILLEFINQDDRVLVTTIDQLKVDHRSIDELAGDIFTLWMRGEQDAAVEKTKLYLRLLKEHNYSEDSSVFPLWKNVGEKEMTMAMKEAGNIIESFGRELYIELIGLSPDAYSYLTTKPTK